jgi:hypothetical protein
MQPHPRIRKTIKWGGAAATVLLVGVLTCSRWWYVGYNSSGWLAGLHNEQVCVFEDHPTQIEKDLRLGSELGWRIEYWRATGPFLRLELPQAGHSRVIVPLWLPISVSLVAAVVAWRLDILSRRRARLNLCPTAGCNYDRTGIPPDAKCPECGH